MDIMKLSPRQTAIVEAALLVAYDCGTQDREPIDGEHVTDVELAELLRGFKPGLRLGADGWHSR